jgi:hypothetical protein
MVEKAELYFLFAYWQVHATPCAAVFADVKKLET